MKTGSFSLSLFIVFATVLDSLTARKTYLVKDETPMNLAAKLRSYDQRVCAYQVGANDWCYGTKIKWEMGWEFLQEYGIYGATAYKYWQTRNNFYTK